MPLVTTKFLAAINGTTRNSNGFLETSIPAGQRSLYGGVINEEFVTTGDSAGYTFTQAAFDELSKSGAEPYASGTGVKVPSAAGGFTIFAVLITPAGQIDIQQTSP